MHEHLKKGLVFALIILCLGMMIGCSGQGRRLGGIVYYTEDMSKVTAERNAAYTKGEKMDIYYPLESQAGEKHHAVMLVHGKSSETNLKDSSFYKSWGELLAASGFTAITFNWRRPDDIAELIRCVRDNAETYRVDPNSITVLAFSAGVEDGLRQGLAVGGESIKSMVGYYGMPPKEILTQNEVLPPILLAVAGLDSKGFIDSSTRFFEEGSSLGFDVQLLEHPKGRHAFDLFNDDDTSREIIRQTLEFIKASAEKDPATR